MSTRAAKNEALNKKGAAAKAKNAKKQVKSPELKDEPIILKTTTIEGEGDDNNLVVQEEVQSEVAPVVDANANPEKTKKAAHTPQNHWSAEAETQLSEQIAHHRQQGYSGPMLWELVSSKCDYNFSAEQCMSKYYREKTKERYKTQGKKRKESSEGSSSVKWNADDAQLLNSNVDRLKGQDHEGSKLWSQVSESLDSKWTPSQCMNKYYRDRHKLQKLNK